MQKIIQALITGTQRVSALDNDIQQRLANKSETVTDRA